MFKDKVQRYSIRKLSVGAASVLIGLAFMSNNNDKVQAAENDQTGAAGTEENTEGKDILASTTKTEIHESENPVEDAANATTDTAETNTLKVQTLSIDNPKAKENTNAPDPAKGLNESKVVAKPTEQKKDSEQAPDKLAHKVTINFIDDTTGRPILELDRSAWAYKYVKSVTGEFKDGDAIEMPHEVYNKDGSHYTAVTRPSIYNTIAGYKLMNEDEINKAFPNWTEQGSPIMYGHKDIDFTYHFAPLADTLIKYVDEDSGATIATITFPNKRLNVESQAHKDGSPNGEAAKYEAAAINIPGYKLVSAPLIEGQIKDNEIKSKDNPNPTILTFKYKKVTPNEVPQEINLNNNAGSKGDGVKLSTDAWATMPGMFTMTKDPKTGKTITMDGRKVEAASQELIDRYTKQGFTYAGTSGKIFDDDLYNSLSDGTSIHLIANQPVTVKYVDENGKDLIKPDTIEFNRNNPDQTNNGINDKKYWHAEGEWTTKAKPIAGYDLVKTIGAEKGDFTLFKYNVTYVYAKHVDGDIKYIDDTDKKDLASDKFEGTVGKNIDYTTADKIKDFESKGYKLVSNNFKDGKQLFAENGNSFAVHFVHATETKPKQKTITRVVNYVDEKDNKVANSVTQTAQLTGSSIIDKVTGKTLSTEWGKANFGVVKTPAVPNYHVTSVTIPGNAYYDVDKDNGDVAATGVTNENENTVVTVHFAKDAVNGTVKYIDDTTGKTLKSDDLKGNVGEKIDYTTADKIKNFEDKGYKLVKTNFQDGSMIFNKEGNNYEVHLAHELIPVDPKNPRKPGEPINPNDPEGPKFPAGTDAKSLTKKITRTVNYVDENGKSLVDHPASESVTLSANGVLDKVTGEWKTPLTWNSSNFKSITTPSVDGYHVTGVTTEGDIYYDVDKDNGNVASTKVTHKNGNTTVTVHFAKADANGTVKYIDDTTGKTLKNDSFGGKLGEKITYTTADKIKNFEDKGYKFVKSNFQDGSMIFNKDGNNYEVHFEHELIPVDPKNPGKPGEPINPNDPEGPKFPAGTDAKSLTKEITRTVSYVDDNGNKIAGSVTQKIDLNGQGVIDKVTGEFQTPITWNKGSFDEVAVPSVEGSHVTSVTTEGKIYYSVDNNGNVAKTEVNHENGNTEVTVHFTKNTPTTPEQPTPNEPEVPAVPETEVPNVPAPHGEDVPTPPSVDEEEDIPAPHGQDIPTDPAEDEEPETVIPHASVEPEAPKAEEETVKPHAAALPQTGAKDEGVLAAIGLALLGLMGVAEAGESKKRRH